MQLTYDQYMFFRLRFYLVAVVFSMSAGLAMSKDLVIDRAIFEDASGQMSLEAVQNATFSEVDQVFFKGFSRSTFWLKLTVDVTEEQQTVSMQTRPNLLDHATLFYKDATQQGLDLMLAMDSRHAQKETRITLAPGKQHLYMRLSSSGALLVWTQVLSMDAANEKAFLDQMKFGGVLALYALLFFALLLLVLEYRRKLIFLFIAHLSVCLIFYLFLFDLRPDIIPLEWSESKTAARLSTIFVFFSFSYLLQEVFGQVDLQKIQRWVRLATGILFLIVILFISGEQYWALKIYSLCATVMTLIMVAVLFKVVIDFVQNREITVAIRFLFGLFSLSFIGITSTAMLQVLGILQPTAFIMESPALRAVFMPIFLIGYIWQYELKNRKEIERVKTEKVLIEIREKEQKKRLLTQSQFMAMLMHELKTPLYVIQIAVSSLSRTIFETSSDAKRLNNIHRSLDDINFILDKCVQADQLDQNDLPINKAVLSLKTLISEVKHLDKSDRIIFSGMADARIFSDYQYARIILINMVTNALKYSIPESNVLIAIENTEVEQDQKIRIRISNSAGSASKPNPQKVFTRYYREESSKNIVGAGLGLWLANSLAIKLGSELQCLIEGDWVHFDFILDRHS